MAEFAFKLKPFVTPNFAVLELPPAPKQEGIKELPSISISELSQDALDDLVQEWVDAVYAKAGKRNEWNLLRRPSVVGK